MQRVVHIFLVTCALLASSCAMAKAKVSERVVYYTSIDQHGDTLTLSGKLSVPDKPKGVVLIPHYTIASNDETPSVTTTPEEKKLRDNYILIMPDYIGYGVTRDRVHPYLRGDLTARNCVDMLLAVQPTVCIDTIILVGFSQGGATVLWTLKLLEEEYAGRIHVSKCFAGSGPYDVAATYDEAIRTNKVALPLVIPMLVMGTSEAYDLGLKREDFFTPELDKIYDDYVASKNRTITYSYFRMLNHKVDHWLTAYGRDKSQPDTRRMYETLLRSSLVHYPLDTNPVGQEVICPGTGYSEQSSVGTWRPKAPVHIFHSYDDSIVTFRCAEHLQRCWADLPNITYDFGHYGGHLSSAMKFYDKVKKNL